MERKRKLPARAARTENVSKNRKLTPPDQRTQTPTPAESPAPVVVEEALPRRIEAGKPLPTVDEPQSENLSSKEYQSVADSGVLQASLHTSRQKWLSEGIFEKYWTKPTKRKGAPEQPANNPGKDTMTKLGHCTITVEPHIFEATMYAIKDTTPRPILSQPQQPMYRPPILQYGPPGGVMPPTAPIPSPQQRPIAAAQPIGQIPKTEDVHMTNSGPTPLPYNSQAPVVASSNGVVSNGQPVANPQTHTPQPPNVAVNPPPSTTSSAPALSRGGAGPVIQMLAEQAATDPQLKALMRVVANGEATQVQLMNFQNHIDELTRLQKARQAAADALQTPQLPPTPPTASSAPVRASSQVNGSTIQQSAPNPTPQVAAPAKTNSAANAPIKPEYQQPQALRSKGPVPSKSDISGVVFEFAGGNGDRYLFPKFSILEYIPGNQVVASFLIVRKGSSSDSPTYDPDLDYYQPITIRIFSSQARQLDALQKVVAPPDEVQRYMNDIMDKATRAEYVLLAMRLPKDTDQNQTLEKDDEEKNEQADPVVGWVTTNPTPPTALKVKPAKKVPTEEDQYQSFIGTVAASV